MKDIVFQRKFIIYLLGIILVLICGVLFFFIFNKSNIKICKFSHKSGFYSKPFYLTIKADKRSKVFYTLDCTKPDQNSFLYEKPVLIEDATQNKNVYSARGDFFVNFFTLDKMSKFNAKKDFLSSKIPNFPVDKAVVLRFAQYDDLNRLLYEDTKIYFVGFDNKYGYKNLPVISVVLEPEDLIDKDKGIYILGKNFNPNVFFEKNDDLIDPFLSNANFLLKGKNAERQAFVSFFDKSKKLSSEGHFKVKIKGHLSRFFAQKSLSILTDDKRNLKFLNQNYNKQLVLNNCSTDMVSKLVDYLVQSFEIKANSRFSTLKMMPCILFLNGEYWGVYYLSENYDKDYIHSHYSVKKNNILLIDKEQEPPKYILDEDKFINKSNLKNKNNYIKASNMIDIDSFIDYIATEIYIANGDWLFGNFAYWRSINFDKKSKFADNKRRYMIYDLNYSSTLTDYKRDTLTYAINNYQIFSSFLKNDEFRAKFKNRIYELENEIYTSENVNKFIDEWLLLMREPIRKNHYRFYDREVYDTMFDEKINDIRKFIEKRPEYMNKYMEQNFAKYEKNK